MRLSQKRTCNGCNAGYILDNNIFTCELYVKTKRGKELCGVTVEFIPCDPCYKPLTYNDYIDARDLVRESRKDSTND